MSKKALRLLLLSSLLISSVWSQGLETTARPDDWEEINFEFNSSVLTDGYPSLLRLAELLQKNPDYKVRIVGHADWIGSNPYNNKLGLARANAVRDFLVKYGARSSQITTASEGETNPKYGTDRRPAERAKLQRWMNRRVTLTVTDGQGRTIGDGGIRDAMHGLDELLKKQTECCEAILKRLDKLDEIANMLRDLKAENDRLRKDVDELRAAQSGLRQQVSDLPRPLSAEETSKIATDAIEASREKRFAILGINVGPTNDGDFTMSGRARYFAPFKDLFAVQAQGEYMRWQDRQEGQFDLGLVARPVSRFQAGLFSSFKHVDFRTNNLGGGTLGQAALTLDYLFSRGRIGAFGTKGFMREDVLARRALSPNVFEETYLRIVDQAGVSATIGLWGRAYAEGNVGYLSRFGGDDKPGGTFRLVQPITERIAVTLDGGFNETLVSNNAYGRVAVGLQFGNFLAPKQYMETDRPVPTDVPRIRYETLTRQVRTGNGAPVVDAGPDQIGVPAGQIALDGSGSFDPEGDPITFEWVQIAGPAVALSGANTARPTFTAEEGQSYSFRLTVTDDKGAKGIDTVTVTTRSASVEPVQIVSFVANPPSIQAGQASTLVWQVNNADEVTITGLGRVDQSGSSSVSPTTTTTYTLTARNSAGAISQSVTITVQQSPSGELPRVANFSASPTTIDRGQSSTLAWSVENATSVQITGLGTVSNTGTQTVQPTETTTYTLTATNAQGQVSTSVTVTVNVPSAPAPTLVACAANPATSPAPGQPVTLTYTAQNATAISVSPGPGSVPLGQPITVQPTATTTYTITATGAPGTSPATCTIQVTVLQPEPPTAVIAGGPILETFSRQVTIDGSQSTDPSGGQLTYIWEPLQTGAAVMDQGQPITRVILAGAFGDYPIRLTVRNAAGLTSEAIITIRFRSTTIF